MHRKNLPNDQCLTDHPKAVSLIFVKALGIPPLSLLQSAIDVTPLPVVPAAARLHRWLISSTPPGLSIPIEVQDEMLTKREMAAKLKVTIRKIKNWQRDGFLPYIKISSVVVFHWPEVLEHLKANFKDCRRGVLYPRN